MSASRATPSRRRKVGPQVAADRCPQGDRPLAAGGSPRHHDRGVTPQLERERPSLWVRHDAALLRALRDHAQKRPPCRGAASSVLGMGVNRDLNPNRCNSVVACPATTFTEQASRTPSADAVLSFVTGTASAADLSVPSDTVEIVAPVVEPGWSIAIAPCLWAASISGDMAQFGLPPQQSRIVPAFWLPTCRLSR